jgi:hypothetical protein
MPVKLTRAANVETLTVEVFDLELDDQSRTEMAANPAAFIRKAIEEAGLPAPNGVTVDETLGTMIIADSHGGAPPPPPKPMVLHVVSPQDKASRYITIVA